MTSTGFGPQDREQLKGPERLILAVIGLISLAGGVLLVWQFFAGDGMVSALTGIVGLLVTALAIIVCLVAVGTIRPNNADSDAFRRAMRADAERHCNRDLGRTPAGEAPGKVQARTSPKMTRKVSGQKALPSSRPRRKALLSGPGRGPGSRGRK